MSHDKLSFYSGVFRFPSWRILESEPDASICRSRFLEIALSFKREWRMVVESRRCLVLLSTVGALLTETLLLLRSFLGT